MRLFALSALLAPLGMACSFASGPGEAGARVWMHHRHWPALVEDETGWEQVRADLDGIKFSIDRFNLGSIDQLRRLGEMMREKDIVSAVECGGLLNMQPMDDTIGERTAEVELAKLDALKQAGITLDYLHLDGPIRRTLNDPLRHGGTTLESPDMAVAELIDYMRLVREDHPSVKFSFGSNFPNWGYKGGPAYT